MLDPATWGHVLGVILLAGGSGVGYLGVRNWREGGTWGVGPAWVPLFVGALFALVGVVVFVSARTTVHRLDRTSGTVLIQSRSLRGSTRRELALDDLRGVVLETSSHQDSDGARSTNYRVAYVLTTGEHVPWTPYFTGTRADKLACIEAVKRFLA